MNKVINLQFARDVKYYNSVTVEFSVIVANYQKYRNKRLNNEATKKIGDDNGK